MQEWCKKNIPGQPIGLAYFGQINPSIFACGTSHSTGSSRPATRHRGTNRPGRLPDLIGPAPRLDAGLLRGERDLALWSAVAALRSGSAWQRAGGLAAGLELRHVSRQDALQLLPRVPPDHAADRALDLRVSSHRRTTSRAINRVLGSEAVAATGSVDSERLAADINLGQVVLAGRAEEDLDLEARLSEQLRQIGPELGEDRIAPVAAGMSRSAGRGPRRPVGPNDRAGECPRRPGRSGTVKT